eukprot:CAMPEP_0201120398 /NCGR_PEP_ID=MMETSP0850-20130426/4459_1 /ASSEMBLY_ACC=CAM_ASM_000622 /TAXON_ID=183588 /ORGANISM="Pseudo-nitzschia fraudulenta, Strain WWA7" /LENGTH=454 /DNA_ID=CAMNT_0047386521 /DNA_START=151 /DNA_END=1512 /DNA_ORIENTATION=-
MDKDIEMVDLLGNTDAEDVRLAKERGAGYHDKTDHGLASARGITFRFRRNWHSFLLVFVVLMGTITFFVNQIYFSHNGSGATIGIDEDKTNQKIKLGYIPSKQASDCIDDPEFQFKSNPEKNCDWASQNHKKVCDKKHKPNVLIRYVCPVACGDCLIKQNKEIQMDQSSNSTDNNVEYVTSEHQVSKTTDEKKSGNEITIVDGIDDKDLYCEDLSQYEGWHKISINKSHGKQYRMVSQMNHDKTSFTQGLTYARGKLFESAGLYGKSTIRILNRKSAIVEKKVPMERMLFAEGLTYYKDTLIQITWKSQRGKVYNLTNLEEIDEFKFTTTRNQGWGITWDRCNDKLIVTDGSENLHFWDPSTMTEINRVSVTRIDGSKAKELNEIEYWRGRVLANVWHEDVILVIDPETGIVEKEYDFSQLWPRSERSKKRADVLNGISISENPDVLYFTGKLW